jgi:hypothetical protein
MQAGDSGLITEYADRSELRTFMVLDWEFPSGAVPMGWEGMRS